MQIIPGKPLSQKWLKAAVIGSIWASVEIILGSFLHNLKIPFSGMILSFISVWLLISFLQLWKENSIILRAGIICALMKSISPSALILGPMIKDGWIVLNEKDLRIVKYDALREISRKG